MSHETQCTLDAGMQHVTGCMAAVALLLQTDAKLSLHCTIAKQKKAAQQSSLLNSACDCGW